MNITIIDIARVVDFKDVKRAIKYYYPTDKNNYESVFEKLKNVKKRKHLDENEFLQLNITDINCGYFNDNDVKKLLKKLKDFGYSIHTTKYGLSFMPWSKIANIPIETETLNRYALEDIMAHLIWEITFYGNEKQTQETAKDLKKRVNDIESGKAKNISHDEVMKELGLKKK